MLETIFTELGAWNWMVLGFVLLAAEIIIPGMFLLWIGIAAILVGTLSLQLSGMAVWSWHLQVVVFLVLAVASAFAGKYVMSRSAGGTDEPLLNKRAEQLIGRTATLFEPIIDGRGRIRLGDTLWRVAGPDLPIGSQVRVKGVADSLLVVEPL